MLAKRLKAVTDLPVVMGFGIATPEQAVAAAAHADGVVVASVLMRERLDGATPEQLGDRVASLPRRPRRRLRRGQTTRTTPAFGSTSMVAPSGRPMAPDAPITAGRPSSRAMTAAWHSGPPSSVTMAPAMASTLL